MPGVFAYQGGRKATILNDFIFGDGSLKAIKITHQDATRSDGKLLCNPSLFFFPA